MIPQTNPHKHEFKNANLAIISFKYTSPFWLLSILSNNPSVVLKNDTNYIETIYPSTMHHFIKQILLPDHKRYYESNIIKLQTGLEVWNHYNNLLVTGSTIIDYTILEKKDQYESILVELCKCMFKHNPLAYRILISTGKRTIIEESINHPILGGIKGFGQNAWGRTIQQYRDMKPLKS